MHDGLTARALAAGGNRPGKPPGGGPKTPARRCRDHSGAEFLLDPDSGANRAVLRNLADHAAGYWLTGYVRR